MGTPVIQDPHFQQSLGFAKGVARRLGAKELSPLILLVGFYLAQRSSSSGGPKIIADNSEAIRRAASERGLDLEQEIGPVEEGTLPLSDDLRRLLTSSGTDLRTFALALVKTIAPAKTVALLQAIEQAAFKMIIQYASSVASSASLSEITPEAFSAGAYAAYKDGRLVDHPSVSAHIAANRKSFEALIEEKGWSRETVPQTASKVLPLNRELRTALESADADSDPLVVAINVGMKVGAELLSRYRTAYHEAGHAVMSSVLRPELPVAQVSIIPEEDSLGATSYEGSPLGQERREDFLYELCVCLAGRAAEQTKFGPDQIDTGARSDLEQATNVAWAAIAKFGLDPELGPVDLKVLAKIGQGSGWLFDRAQQRLQQVMKEASDRANKLLHENWAQVEAVAKALIEKKKLNDDELMTVLVEKTLANFSGVRRARTKPVERRVTFATTSGVHQTIEGAVRHDAGAAIVFGADGQSWPVSRAFLEKNYQPVDPQKAGLDGDYRKNIREVLAIRLDEAKRVDLSKGRGLLLGQAGDWIVDHGDGDLAVVAAKVFSDSFELLDAPVETPAPQAMERLVPSSLATRH